MRTSVKQLIEELQAVIDKDSEVNVQTGNEVSLYNHVARVDKFPKKVVIVVARGA